MPERGTIQKLTPVLDNDQPAVLRSDSTVLLARQPIFDRNRQVRGYELLYRADSTNQCSAGGDAGQMTARVIVNYLLNVGIDHLVGSKLSFINVDREMLLSEHLMALPRDRVVLEVLETVEADGEVMAVCADAKSQGFTLALDDVDQASQNSPLLNLVNIIKVDFRRAPFGVRKELARRFSRSATTMLAEKVESEEEFRQALTLGYQYFQGYFFARPTLVSGRTLSVSSLTLLQILAELTRSEVRVSRLEALVKQQVSLSYKLIRYINSGAFSWHRPIQSLQHALALLGTDLLRKLLSLMVVADIGGNCPRELFMMALLRARMLELLCPSFGLADREASLFLMGLFSLLDAILQRPLEEILTELNLEEDLSNALLGRGPDGPIRRLYELVITHEAGDWSGVSRSAEEAKIDLSNLTEGYVQALKWADTIVRA